MNRRILLIDDMPSIHEDFRKILSFTKPHVELEAAEEAIFGIPSTPNALGFELDSAFQGQEGLAMVTSALEKDRSYAMAFVDMRMPPGWDGCETIQRIWEKDPFLQIVICTAYSDYSWGEVLKKLDASDRLLILKKPFDNVEVFQLATTLTTKWEMTRRAALKMNTLETIIQERTREIMSMNDVLQAEIAERKLLESQLVHAQKMESIGQLAAGIAHEVNTPTQYVADNTRFLKYAFQKMVAFTNLAIDEQKPEGISEAFRNLKIGDLNDQIPAAIDDCLTGLARIAEIVRAMKEFSHPDSRLKAHVDLNKAIECTVTVASSEWKQIADVQLDLDPGLPQVPCYAGELNQAVLNIIINAAHAIAQTSRAGTIRISTSRQDKWIEIRIADTGCGIAREIRDRIFDPFFTTKEVGQGTGQGLSIAHQVIVAKHHGTIEFESEPGSGATFIIRLPLADAPNSLAA